MLDTIAEFGTAALGLDRDELGLGHMALRAVVVFVFAVALVRVAERRFIGENTAFDLILGVVLGSVVSRAITGQSPFFPTLGAAAVLVACHYLLARLALGSDWFGTWVKGTSRVLVRDGEVDWEAMRRSNLTKDDLLGALRLQASLTDWQTVREARLERNGEISVIPKDG